MRYEDLSFTIRDEAGNDVVCDIVSVVPNEKNKEEPYVVFTDYVLDKDDEFVYQYGKLIEVEDEFVIKSITDPSVIDLIKAGLEDDIVSYVNEQVQENMHE